MKTLKNIIFYQLLNNVAILYRVYIDGCALFIHQRDTIATSLPKFSANHLPVLPCSTKTLFILFNSVIYIYEQDSVNASLGTSLGGLFDFSDNPLTDPEEESCHKRMQKKKKGIKRKF